MWLHEGRHYLPPWLQTPLHHRHHLPSRHTNLRTTLSPFHNIRDREVILITAERLQDWYKRLKNLDNMRSKVATMQVLLGRIDRRAVLDLMDDMKSDVRALKGEVQDKLYDGVRRWDARGQGL